MLRRCFTLALAALASLLAPAPFAGTAQAQQIDAHPSWFTFRSDEGRFSVLFPAPPQRNDQRVEQGLGAPWQATVFTALAGGGIYIAGYIDYSPTLQLNIQGELEANRNNFISGQGATLLSSTPISLGNAPGLEFTAEKAGEWFYRSRLFVVGRRPYQVLAMVRPARANSPEIGRFLDSMAIDGTR